MGDAILRESFRTVEDEVSVIRYGSIGGFPYRAIGPDHLLGEAEGGHPRDRDGAFGGPGGCFTHGSIFLIVLFGPGKQ